MHKPLKQSFGVVFPEAGCDEAGRGCLAGPVFAAAVILPEKFPDGVFDLLQDSKKLSAGQRHLCKTTIMERAVSFGVSMVDAAVIDEINILNASVLAMQQALEQLKPQPATILVDGNRFKPYNSIPYHCVVRGDATYMSIAAASVLAKTARDEYMEQLHGDFPHYGWNTNKGYPTPAHRDAIARYGLSPYHRLSFRQYPQLRLGFGQANGKN
ncbi:MAG: ribonuclease HII [Bacteroidales bacterium]|nr:ribonuclease HII [Bacteroidales bacterium]